MFEDASAYPFTSSLEAWWETIRDEYTALRPDQFEPWPETKLYDTGWSTLGFFALQHRIPSNCALCPQTAGLLESIPGVVNAGFSVLAPQTIIRPHQGYTGSVLRFHLGLIVPEDCALQVGDEVRPWAEGRVFAFDDTTTHSAWNNADTERVVLLLDILRPGARLEVTPRSLAAVKAYIQRLS